jgi:hypothetical protein
MSSSSRMWTGTGEKDDVIVPLEAVENAAHPLDDRLYFEHWYFDARLEDGHVIVGFIQTSELVRSTSPTARSSPSSRATRTGM